MAKESIGIYLSAKYVDIVQLIGSPNAPHLKNFIREEIASPAAPPAGKENKEEPSQKDLSSRENISFAIKEGLRKMGIKLANVNTILPTSDVMIRYFNMPSIPKSEQDQAVKFEVRKYIPFKVDKLVSDFKVLSPDSKSKRNIDVFFIAATKDNLVSHLDLFKKADADAIGVDIIPFALLKVLILCRKLSVKDNAAVLYIDNDRTSASIHITERGIPFLSRDIKISTSDKDAFFEKVVSEIRVSLDYYHRQKPQTEISKVILCGEKLCDGLDKFVADELKIITETLDSFTGIRSAGKVAPSFAIAVGAALGGLGKSYFSVNLSPLAAVKEKRKIANIVFVEAMAAVFIIILLFISTSIKSASLWAKLKSLQNQQKDVMPEIISLSHDALNAMYQNVAEELRFLEAIVNYRISWTQILDRLAKDLPDDIWITGFDASEYYTKDGSSEYSIIRSRNISIIGNAFSLDGSSKEIERISGFLSALKEDSSFSRFFSNIELGPIDQINIMDRTVSSFQISVTDEGLKKGQ